MEIIKKYLTNGQYLTTVNKKVCQFLHHTVGTNAKGAWNWWNSTPARVGTPYIIDRDGSILEVFNPKYWAYHLGINGDDNWHEKHSINIELVAAGPLRYIEDEYRFYPLWPNKLRYTVIPEEEVHTFETPWKGFNHWHKYTEAQLESLKWLIGKNCLEFPDLVIDNDIDDIFNYNGSVIENHEGGIWTHNTVRKDKSDPFPYPPLIEALKEVQEEILGVKKASTIEEVTVTAKKGKKGSRKKK